MQFVPQKLCRSFPLSLFEISAMCLDVEIDTIIVPLPDGKLVCRLLRALIRSRLVNKGLFGKRDGKIGG